MNNSTCSVACGSLYGSLPPCMWRQVRLAAAEREAASSRVSAEVTPERCRASAKALVEEAARCGMPAWQQGGGTLGLQPEAVGGRVGCGT